jgi:PAS domain S-box-containing protein
MDLSEISSMEHAGWREPVALILDENGMIRDCSHTSEELFGYKLRELISLHVSKLLPQLSEFDLIQNGQFNPRFVYLCHCGHLFTAQKSEGGTFLSELCLVNLYQAGKRILKLFVLPSFSLESELSFG